MLASHFVKKRRLVKTVHFVTSLLDTMLTMRQLVEYIDRYLRDKNYLNACRETDTTYSRSGSFGLYRVSKLVEILKSMVKMGENNTISKTD